SAPSLPAAADTVSAAVASATVPPLSSTAATSPHALPFRHRSPDAPPPVLDQSPDSGLAPVSAPPLGTSPRTPGSTLAHSCHVGVLSLRHLGTAPRSVSLAGNSTPASRRLPANANCAPSLAPALPLGSTLSCSIPFSPIFAPPPPRRNSKRGHFYCGFTGTLLMWFNNSPSCRWCPKSAVILRPEPLPPRRHRGTEEFIR